MVRSCRKLKGMCSCFLEDGCFWLQILVMIKMVGDEGFEPPTNGV